MSSSTGSGNGSYDSSVVIAIDTDTEWSSAQVLGACADLVAALYLTLNGVLSTLDLGWAGKSADQAQSFATQYQTATAALFGSSSADGSASSEGALPKVVSAVQYAALNFAAAEDAVTALFAGFDDSDSGSGGSTIVAPTSDPSGPVTEENTLSPKIAEF